MNTLCWCEIKQNLSVPDFGEAFQEHIRKKKHPAALCSTLSAWNLLALMLKEAGYTTLPTAAFSETGKPYFENIGLYFSLAHSKNLAAALISDDPCAVDVELVQPHVAEKLRLRCLSEDESAAGCDFFEIWTKKECIAKLDGRGMSAHPNQINTLDARYENAFFTCRLQDALDNEYVLSALPLQGNPLTLKKSTIIK